VGGLALVAFVSFAVPFLCVNFVSNYFDNYTLSAVTYQRAMGALNTYDANRSGSIAQKNDLVWSNTQSL